MKSKAGKKDKSINLLILALIAGLCLMIYPSLANFINQRTATRAIATYSEDVVKIKPEDYSKMIDAAKEYNKRLLAEENPLARFEKVPGYNDILNIGDTGIMGVINIDKINVELPIYHGTSEEILNVAVGHMQGSSFPVGGKGTHAVLTGHRGLPSARLFTDLDQLQEGDTFTITVLDQTVTYTVDQIRIVPPTEVDDLKIVPDDDYFTLRTCTPYGINTHRLLVRGTRTSNAKINPMLYVQNDGSLVNPLITAPSFGLMILLAIIVVQKLRKLQKKKKAEKLMKEQEEEQNKEQTQTAEKEIPQDAQQSDSQNNPNPDEEQKQ